MTQDRPGDLSNTTDVLPESIRRAVAAAAVEPISSMENLTSELTSDTELQGAYESNLSNNLSQRIEKDKDFKPDRFPNTEEYFHKGSDKKWIETEIGETVILSTSSEMRTPIQWYMEAAFFIVKFFQVSPERNVFIHMLHVYVLNM